MSRFGSLRELESLFIEKLQEKYKLNIRDLKKAFSRFDLDGNGLLDLSEMVQGIKMFLNGVSDAQVEQLVERYDTNGDGKLSYEEFLDFLTNRKPLDDGMGDLDEAYDDGMRPLVPPPSAAAAAPPRNFRRAGREPMAEGGVAGAMEGVGYSGAKHSSYSSDAAVVAGMDDDLEGNSNYAPLSERALRQLAAASVESGAHNNRNSTGAAVARGVRGGVRGRGDGDRGILMPPPPPMPAADRDERGSEAPSTIDVTNPRELEYRAKIYLSNLKKLMHRRVTQMRMAGRVPDAATMQRDELHESVSRKILEKAFQPYTGKNDGRAQEVQQPVVEFADFAKVLRSFQFPGTPSVRTETIQYIFDVCSLSIDATSGNEIITRNSRGVQVVDPNAFIDLIFGEPIHPADRKRRGLPFLGPRGTGGQEEYKKVVEMDADGFPVRGFVEKLEAGRQRTARGPLKLLATDAAAGANEGGMQTSTILTGADGSSVGGMGATAGAYSHLLAVPQKFLSRKSRSALMVPSKFDPLLIRRSTQLPTYDLQLHHVFGMMARRYSGNMIHVLPSTPPSFHPQSSHSNHRPGSSSNSNSAARSMNVDRRNSSHAGYIDGATLVYGAAALGIVHDLSSNTQHFFDDVPDDVTCISVSRDGKLVALGCMGKWPVVQIFSTNIAPHESKTGALVLLGHKFFERAVCAVEFSYDNKYVIGIGCDDYHMLGVFEISTKLLVCNITSSHGVPPMVKWMRYCPAQQFTEYISREHSGLCDVFATCGERSIKIWSFRRPTREQEASLSYSAGSTGKAKVSPAKNYNCVDFIGCEDKTFDCLAGGSNGIVYMWKRGVIVAFSQAIRGGVSVLAVLDDKVYVGGAGGVLKVLDGRTLVPLKSFNLLVTPPKAGPKITAGAAGPMSGGAGQKSRRPASAGRPQSIGRRPGTTTSGTSAGASQRPALNPRGGSSRGRARAGAAAPPPQQATHAAGGNPTLRARDDAVNVITGKSPGDERREEQAGMEADMVKDEGIGSRTVTGLAVVPPAGRGPAQFPYVIATLGTGKAVRVDIGSTGPTGGGAGGARPSSRGSARPLSAVPVAASAGPAAAAGIAGKDLFYFHTGDVWGLATDPSPGRRLVATVCDGCQLLVWDGLASTLIAKTSTQGPSRCCAFDKTCCFIAVGGNIGSVTIYYLSDQQTSYSNGALTKLSEIAYRKDCIAESTDIKFSPNNEMLAMSTHAQSIYVYSCAFDITSNGQGRNMSTSAKCLLKAMYRLKGHSAAVSAFDWSADSMLIRSTCHAYELLCWDVTSGKQFPDMNPADVRWKTFHTILGFNLMGIWPPYSDGTDVNGVDVCNEKGLVAVANDADGLVTLFNYPCVVKDAPAKMHTGHSSQCMNCKFLPGGERLVSIGGKDQAIIAWKLVTDENLDGTLDAFR